MKTGETKLRTLRVIGLAAAGGAGVKFVQFWIEWISDISRLIRTGHLATGLDFAMMYTGAKLASAGRWADAYHLERFLGAYNSVTGLTLPAGAAVFPYPPSTALALVPQTLLPLQSSLILWLTVSLVAFVLSTRLLRIPPLAGAAILLLTAPAYMTIRLGQNTMFSLLIVSVALGLLRRGNRFAAGVAIGLLVLKPQLLIGFGLWWLMAPRTRIREGSGAVVGVLGVLIPSFAIAPDAWRIYLESFSSLAAPPGMIPLGSFSWLDFVRFLFQGHPAASLIVSAVGLTALIAGLGYVLKEQTSDPELAFALAVLATVLLSPRIVVYDWLLLVVPGAVVWQRVPRLQAQITLSAGLLSLASLVNSEAVARSLNTAGWALAPAFPILVLVVLWLAPRLRSEGEPSAVEANRVILRGDG